MTAANCPWCSAELPSPQPEHCPSCGAQLVATASADVPGVTQVDLAALTRGDPIVAPPKRSLLGFISGEYQVEEPVAPPQGSLAPPADEVRREMLRMEIEAAEAEAAALKAEAEIEAREAAEDAAAAASAAEAPSTDGSDEPDAVTDEENVSA